MLFCGVDDGVDGADKHLTHLSQAADCYLKERSKQSKHVVGNEEDGIDDVDDDGVDNSDDGANKHLTHLSHLLQAADCCLSERSKQNKQVVCNKDDGVDDGVDN
eukprot:4034832-Ditylum_brightwellii.AAC.1